MKYLPNYKDGSIVNLMSSVLKSFGGMSHYGELEGFDPDWIKDKSLVFLVIDGLGYEYLKKYGQGSFLESNLKSRITSVFPSTTASAMTSFYTGLSPAEHGLMGWFMYLKEIGQVILPLHFSTRAGNVYLGGSGISYQDIISGKSIFNQIGNDYFVVNHSNYIDSPYSRSVSVGAKKISYKSFSGLFSQIRKTLNSSQKRKFVFSYWSDFDSICHKFGTDSSRAKNHFEEIDRQVSLLAKFAKKRNAVIIITADHGLMDVKPKNIIKLKDHPELEKCLTLPLSGEGRATYCYVRPEKVSKFEKYVRRKMGKFCQMRKSSDLIEEGYFGSSKINPKLYDRVGDYVLIMKDGYLIQDTLLGEERNDYLAHHGGLSREEMFVPLIVI
ncbi:MAG: alkaline phosphatase family protein [Patescibacteria group bacterium]